MALEDYIAGLQAVLEQIKSQQLTNIKRAGQVVAAAISAGGIIHTFGTGHSHLIAHEVFFRAGGIAAINPILDERLIFLKGALESSRAERESGFASKLITREDVREEDAAIIISNSGRNAVPVEMALEMKSKGVKVIAITNLEQSLASAATHSSGKRLCEIADVTIDNCVPKGDALLSLPGANSKLGPSSTVAGAAIINSIIVAAVSELLERGEPVPVLPSANLDGVSENTLRNILAPYKSRIKYLDVDESTPANNAKGHGRD
ncbi:MAG TPA: SIS domain-containing protein [Pyrinomonadaceae bacterium]|nr:SIS domain-containing protein [Pyrinomonadaceae bacterium]